MRSCDMGGEWQEEPGLFEVMPCVQPDLETLHFWLPSNSDGVFASHMLRHSNVLDIQSLRECKASEMVLHNLLRRNGYLLRRYLDL